MVGEAILAEAIANSKHGLFSPTDNASNDPVEREEDKKKNNVLVWNGSGSGVSDGSSVLYGEADRYYVHGMQLDENGQARAAAAAYLEAATLYQCCLDFDPSSSQNPFGHVTSSTEIQSLLASVALRLAHVNQDALGDPKSATRLYKDVCYKMKFPSDTALDGMGTSLEASGKNEEALDAYQSALKLNPKNHRVKFHLAVLLERLSSSIPEYEEESTKLMEELRRSEAVYACLVDSWGYVRWHTRRQPDANLYRGTKQMLQVGIQAALPLISSGLVCEFGVAQGRSLRLIQELCPLQTPIYGFDTFTGLPMAWGTALPAGAFSTNGVLPSLGGGSSDSSSNDSEDVQFHKGLFQDSIPQFLSSCPDKPLAFANIDCFLYSSTLDILEAMHGRIVPGTVFCFDDYMCHPSWRQDEFRAWRECCKRFGWQYEYLAFSFATRQTVVRVTSA